MNTVIVASSVAAASLATTAIGTTCPCVFDDRGLSGADIGRGTRLVVVLPMSKNLAEAAVHRARQRGAEVIYATIKGLTACTLAEPANEPVEAA